MAFWDDFNADPAAYFGHGPSPSNTVRSTEMANSFGTFFENPPSPGIYQTQQDAMPVTRAEPERPRHWTYDLVDLLKAFSGGGKQGAGQVGAAGSPVMAYVPPTGKGGGVDVVKLAMMIFGGAAGGMGGMGGAGGAGAAGAAGGAQGAGVASGSSMGQANQAMGMMQQFGGMGGGGGGGGGGKDVTPPAQPMAMMQLPYMTIPGAESPGPLFGQNAMPSTLDFFRPKQRNTLFPGNPYG